MSEQPSQPAIFGEPHLACPHMLPYRAMFAEMLEHNPGKLAHAMREDDADTTPMTEQKRQLLHDLVKTVEDKYGALEDAKKTNKPAAEVSAAEAACQAADEPLKQVLHRMENSALSLSGGGIRSATFSVGVMQGLARAELLDKMDFLSTVSGGGYAGCWLMAWANKEGWAQVVKKLSRAAPTSGDPEPAPLRHLRDYSSYLNPSYGLSLDTATLAIIVLRNLILNWLMFAPSLIAVLCVPVLFSCWTARASANAHGNPWMLTVAAALLTFGLVFAMVRAFMRPNPNRYPIDISESGWEWAGVAAPVILGCWLVMLCWFHGDAKAGHDYLKFFTPQQVHDSSAAVLGAARGNGLSGAATSMPPYFWLTLVGLMPMLGGWLIRFAWPDGNPQRLPYRWKRGLAVLACVPAALTFAGLQWGFAVLFSQDINTIPPRYLPDFMTIFGLPMVTLLVMTGFAVQEGMLSHVEMEEEREWWARGAGMLLLVVVWWSVLFGLALGADMLVMLGVGSLGHTNNFTGTLSTAITLIASWLTAKLGGSRFSGAGLGTAKRDQMGAIKKWISRNGWMPQVLAAILLGAIFFLLGTLAAYWRSDHTLWKADLGILAACALVALLANLFVNANTFSLHGMYRMRLVRAYLGASNSNRNPNPFTNFDPDDDLPLANVQTQGAPLHILNCNLNLVDTKVLSWQQRMGESFTFSRVYSGSWRTGYVPTSKYAGFEGIKMGTAMAISGAAASPNMGYNSSPLMTFLMTLFNARLGWWLPNANFQRDQPRPAIRDAGFLRRNSPTWSMVPLVNEAIGRTDDRFKWIQLSDGGHFENLGIYEMVMRRVKTIVLVDADADRTCQLGDLGNAVRKIYIDLGIPIEMEEMKMGEGMAGGHCYCAIGRIRYSCVDPKFPPAADANAAWDDDPRDGVLIYLKPQLTGEEPEDILAYARTHTSFPHETTANQFFNESQFESYRHLGSYAMEVLTGNKPAPPGEDPLHWFTECCRDHVGQSSGKDAQQPLLNLLQLWGRGSLG